MAASPAAAADLLFQAEGRSLTGACDASAVRLDGNHDVVTLTGMCRSLLVRGVGNTVSLALAQGGSVRVEGSGNHVAYAAPRPGPTIELLGPDNEAAALASPPAAQPGAAPGAAAVPIPPPAPAGRATRLAPSQPGGILALGGNDQERSATCEGGEVFITGQRSAYEVSGACRAVTVLGDLLTIRVSLRPGARLRVTGRGDIVTWTTTQGGRPPASIVRGPDSRVQQALPPG